MKHVNDAQVLVRMQQGMKEFVHELAQDEGCSVPEWVREAIMLRIELETGLEFAKN